MKILIADDNKENRYLLETILKNGGNDVICAENGKKALALLYEQPVDLIISDVLMPEMDGFRLCIKCKNDKKLEKIPIILITANYIRKKDEEFAFMLGAEKFLLRPIEPDALLGIVKEVTDKAKNQGVAAHAVFDENTLEFLKMYNDRVVEQVELKVEELEEDILQRRQAESNLKERIKELEIYNTFINIIEGKNIALDQIFNEIVNTLPKSWQYPDITCAKITVAEKEYRTKNYTESAWNQFSQIMVNGSVIGSINISYLAQMPNKEEGPFSKEERCLIDNIAKLLGEIIERKKSEDALKESEERLSSIFNTTGDVIFLLDVEQDGEYRFNTVNPAFLSTTGLQAESVVGKSIKDIIPEPSLALVLGKYRQAIQKKTIVRWEETSDYPGGKLTALVTIAPILDVDGKCQHLVGNVHDITNRKKAEEEVKNLAKFPEENPNPVGRTDYDGKLLYCNHNCNKKFKDKNFTCNNINPKLLDTIKKVAAENSYKPENVEIVMDDRTFLFTVVPVKGQNYINFYGKDITELKNAEEALLLKNFVFDESIAANSIANIDGVIIEVNDAFCKMWGYPDKYGAVGKPLTHFFNNPDDVIATLSAIKKLGKWVGEFIAKRKDGSIFNAFGMATDIKDKNSKIVGYQSSVIDVTERKLIEESLKASYTKTAKVLEETIKTLSAIVEIRDPYTSGHQQRVTQIATLIAKELGLEDDRASAISTAATVHDIGKINIAASILSKPGKISELEFEMIKTHSETGYDMLKNIDFSWPVANIVLQHHERINGSGYPKGLKGDDIMLEAKIIAVADVVEAMSSHRPYRPSLGIDQALKEIEKNKAILYDSGVVDACIKIFRQDKFEF